MSRRHFRGGAALALVEQSEAELAMGKAAPRDRLLTVVGSDTSYAIRSVAAAAPLHGIHEAASVLIACVGWAGADPCLPESGISTDARRRAGGYDAR